MDPHTRIFKQSWGMSANKDPNGDGIVEEDESGYIYEEKGAKYKKSFLPLFYNSMDIFKVLTLMIVVGLGTMNVYKIISCKTRFLESTRPFQTQFVLFLVFYINTFIVAAESTQKISVVGGTSTITTGFLAFLALILFNILARVGETWAFYRIPFFPGPMTWWGIIIFALIFLFIMTSYREKYQQLGDFNTGDIADKNFYYNIEIITLFFVFVTIIIRFLIETVNQKTILGNKFNFINFLFGLEEKGKKIFPDWSKRKIMTKGHCQISNFKSLDKEIKKGYDNSPWTKFLKYAGIEK
jgi:hypothetical protein